MFKLPPARLLLPALVVLCLLASAGAASASTLVAGGWQSCAIRAGGDIGCWGAYPGNGTSPARVPVAVDGVADAIDISAGLSHTCAVRANHTVGCWGYEGDGQLGDGGSPSSEAHTPVTVPGVTDAVAVAAGGWHTCALRGGGTVKCWGRSSSGQLGGSGGDGNGITRVIALAAGEASTCAIRHSGELRCWGRDASLTPAIGDAAAVAAGTRHACALHDGGSVSCWGRNVAGQLGIGTTSESESVAAVPGIADAVAVGAGDEHSCALRATGAVLCWGRNASGQLGDGTLTDRSSPVPVTGVTDATALAVGWRHTCVRRASGAVRCWGYNGEGQLGDGTTSIVDDPVTVPGTEGATYVREGFGFVCALVGTGVKCWGLANGGQNSPLAAAVPGVSDVADMRVGGSHACALRTDQSVACWGANYSGELGDGTTNGRAAAATVAGVAAAQLGVVNEKTCVVTTDVTPKVSCWGRRTTFSGQVVQATPLAVPGTEGATAVAMGGVHNCALIAGGTVKCWGQNSSGQLGTGNNVTAVDAVTVTGISTATEIAAVTEHGTCARLADTTIKCWGIRPLSINWGSTPVTISGTEFPVGFELAQSCALSGGAVTCSGNGLTGMLGTGYQPTGHFPVQLLPTTAQGLGDVRQPLPPHSVVPADFALSPVELAFPGTAVGPTSDPVAVTITNVSQWANPLYMELSGAPPGGDFEQVSTTCDAGFLDPGASCSVAYVFHPTAPGPRSATATISVGTGARTIALSGSGLSGLLVTPAGVTFPDTRVGARSAALPVNIVNVSGGTRTLDLLLAGLGSDFSATNDCPPSLTVGTSCTVMVTFHPTAGGRRTASASVSLAGVPSAVSLTGVGTLPSNAFKIRAAKANGKRLTLQLVLPGPGVVRVVATARVKGKKRSYATKRVTVRGGTRKLQIAASRKAKAALKKVKRGKITLRVTFTPAGGAPATKSKTVTVKRPKKR